MTGKRLYHSVAESIKAKIQDGTWPPGTRLPGERELADQFDVSRVTIREAEIALQALGFVSIKTGSGVYVMDPEERGSLVFPNISAFELTEARLMFESEAAALAARHIDDRTLAHLESLVEIMSGDRSEGSDPAVEADREFHLAIARASGNAAVRYVIESLWKIRSELPEVRDVHARICAVEDAADRYEEHASVLRALRSRDPSAARRAMQDHFRSLLESMIDMTEAQELQKIQQRSNRSRQRYLQGVVSGDGI